MFFLLPEAAESFFAIIYLRELRKSANPNFRKQFLKQRHLHLFHCVVPSWFKTGYFDGKRDFKKEKYFFTTTNLVQTDGFEKFNLRCQF